MPPSPIDGDPFGLGVASGDPDDTSVVLWTRFVTPDGTGIPEGAPRPESDAFDKVDAQSRAFQSGELAAVASERWVRNTVGSPFDLTGEVAGTRFGVSATDSGSPPDSRSRPSRQAFTISGA